MSLRIDKERGVDGWEINTLAVAGDVVNMQLGGCSEGWGSLKCIHPSVIVWTCKHDSMLMAVFYLKQWFVSSGSKIELFIIRSPGLFFFRCVSCYTNGHHSRTSMPEQKVLNYTKRQKCIMITHGENVDQAEGSDCPRLEVRSDITRQIRSGLAG